MKWAIIGCGGIADNLMKSMAVIDNAEVVACGSKSIERAKSLADRHSIPAHYDSYEVMLTNEEIDAVYIATTHNFHHENAMMCIKHNKHMLIEKPIGVNAKEAQDIFEKAKEKDLFVMEAMWTRFLPVVTKLQETISSGAIGDIVLANIDFGFRAEAKSTNRFYNPELAGGSLLDMGIYPLTFANLLFNCKPNETSSDAFLTDTGVDGTAVYTLKYDTGFAKLSTSITTNLGANAMIYGTEGVIDVKEFFYAKEFTIRANDGEITVVKADYEATGKQFEIIEAMNCINDKKLESSVHPHSETIWYMNLMDTFRKDWGLIYPFEK